MLKKIDGRKGLYQMSVNMPASPTQFAVPKYFLPQTYGRVEQEEAAARIITICQEAGCWCGISVERLYDMMQAEYHDFRRYKENDERYHKDLARFERQRILHVVLAIVTLGIWALLFDKPKPPAKPPTLMIPFSGIFMSGFGHVRVGLQELLDRGMIHLVDDVEADSDVIFPTPKLLEPITRFQRSN